MTENESARENFDQAVAEIPSCALTEQGIAEQRDRYARLSPSVGEVRREADAVEIEFSDALDQELLDETLAVERGCCPFFLFAQEGNELRVTVREPAMLPALDAFAAALGRAHGAR